MFFLLLVNILNLQIKSLVKTTLKMLSFLFQIRTVTVQGAGIFLQQEFKQFWIRVRFAKHYSDNTLHLLGKAISYEVMNKDSSEVINDNPYDSLDLVFMIIR